MSEEETIMNMKNSKAIFNFFVNLFEKDYFEDMDNETNEFNDLELLVKDNVVYMDTSSFMYFNVDEFLVKIIPILECWNKKIYTLSCCIREINKHINNNDREKREKALKAKDFIYRLRGSNLLHVIDYSEDTFADADFLSYFMKKRIKERILFITQDGDLSVDAYNLNKLQSVNGQFITVKSIDKYGNLCDNYNLRNYIDDENNENSDDDFYYNDKCENVNFINNNSGGINICAHSIDNINIIDGTTIITQSSPQRVFSNSFWHSIY